MANCPNKNTLEYKALQKVFTTELSTNNIINTWQEVNNTDVYPTVLEAETFLKNSKIAFALKQKKFKENLLENLSREKIIHQYLGTYYINNSDPKTRKLDVEYLKNNYNKLKKYLEINNIPVDSVLLTRTKNTYKVDVESSLFTPKDLLPQSRSWDTVRSRAVVKHLLKMFPQIRVKLLSVSEAENLYNTIPQWKKTTANFSQVNSFYIDGTAYLVKGRVTDETAIEEMLHPFIDAIKVDNRQLFDGLLAEAKKNFPELTEAINNAYNDDRNFTQVERDLEIVTQVLSRHFKKEYETTPSQSFLNKIQEALEWFLNVINDLAKYLTGAALPVTSINSNTNFSDLAKLLNVEGIEFQLKSQANGKIRYSLTPQKQKVINTVLDQANGIQSEIIKKMFHVVTNEKEEFDSLSVNLNLTDPGNDIVVLNEKNHTYYNITTGEEYLSTTTAIKGKLKNLEDVQLNLEIGNDIDTLLDAVVSFESFESILGTMKILNAEQAKEMFDRLTEQLKILKPAKSIAISQVVLFDPATKIAGTADLVIIDPDGKIKIIDLKTSKNSIYNKSIKDFSGTSYESREWTLSEDSLLKQKGIDKLSTSGQHNLQVNMYRRMLENMGYSVLGGDQGAATYHIVADITGKGKDQKFNGKFSYDGIYQHNESSEIDKINLLMPLVKDNIGKRKLDEKIKDDLDQPYIGRDDESVNTEETEETVENVEYPEYNTIFGALQGFTEGLLVKQQALETIDNKVFLKKGLKLTRDEIAKAIALISMNIGAGSAARSQTYTAMLRYGLREMREFKEYVTDPNNVTNPEYIKYVMNFDRFMATYRSLFAISESVGGGSIDLNATQKSLVLSMTLEYNQLNGTKDNDGIINQAIFDYVTEQVRLKSNMNFGAENSLYTEDDLKEIIYGGGDKFSRDITVDEYLTKDTATSSQTMIAVMDKIHKRQTQVLLDKIAYRNRITEQLGEKLLKLSPTNDKNRIYDYMIEYDSDGKPLGFYIKKIGQKYYKLSQDLYSLISDDDGTRYEYRDIVNLDTASPEDIAYNIDLANKKLAYSEFMKAEVIDADGNRRDGNYHKYTTEFIDARNEFEYLNNGYWLLKNNYNKADYAVYRAKYYENRVYTKAIRINGVATGAILRNQDFNGAVKKEYVEAREVSEDGIDMRSEKYIALYDPNKTDALTLAQREYYEFFIQTYEKDLLMKLPQKIRDQMIGRLPLIMSNVVNTLKGEGSLFTKLYANMVTGWKNFTETTASEKTLITDENGTFYNGLPIFFTGSPSTDSAIKNVETEILALKDDYKKQKLTRGIYLDKLAILNGKANKLRNRPSLGQVNTDMTSSLIQFGAMAENYEVMGAIEDTLNAFVKVISNKTYQPANQTIKNISKKVEGVMSKAGFTKKNTGNPSWAEKRARKFMSMIFYDNELATKGMLDKIADNLISLSSLTYVAFNPLGNFNNYLMGRINNNIEMLGSRYFSKHNFLRAGKEYNLQGLQSGIFQRLGSGLTDIADIATLGKTGIKVSTYDPDLPNNLYEAFVEDLRMMDASSDIRESGNDNDGKTIWQRFKEWGYVMQDAAEYNVQTRVGMAMIMDVIVKNSKTGETRSYYDAHTFDTVTHQKVLMDGYDTVINKDGNEKPLDDNFRYEMHNKIREVNKQIHGNYAKADRMVLQSFIIGNLAAQYKKWVAPAIRSRFQKEYFDENLGHMEGRYRSWWKFMAHLKQQIFIGNRDFSKMKQSFLEEYGYKGQGGNRDQYATNKLLGFYRTMGELGIIMSIMAIDLLVSSMTAGEDDDPTTIRLRNALKKQSGRLVQETTAFVPVFPNGWMQLFGMIESPVAATKNLEDMAEALQMTIYTPYGFLTSTKEEFYANPTYVYQNKPNAGMLKLGKEWKDALPILHSIQTWDNLTKEQKYNIRY